MQTIWKNYSYAIIFIMLSLMIGTYMILNLEDKSESYQQIVVTDGQSLWELANLYADEHSLSPTEFIKWVQDKNELVTTSVKKGETIVIPVKVKKHIDNKNEFAFESE